MKWYNILTMVVILLVLVFFQRRFFPETNTIIYTDTTIITKDSIVYKDSLIPYAVKLPVDSVIIPADSAKLVARYLVLHREFFTEKYFADSVKIDSVGDIKVKFKVTQNSVFDYSLKYNLQSKKIVTQTLANPKNSLYIGGTVGLNNISPIVIVNNKDKYNYFVSYNLIRGELNVGVAVNINRIKMSRLW